jgi:hypothetical protein
LRGLRSLVCERVRTTVVLTEGRLLSAVVGGRVEVATNDSTVDATQNDGTFDGDTVEGATLEGGTGGRREDVVLVEHEGTVDERHPLRKSAEVGQLQLAILANGELVGNAIGLDQVLLSDTLDLEATRLVVVDELPVLDGEIEAVQTNLGGDHAPVPEVRSEFDGGSLDDAGVAIHLHREAGGAEVAGEDFVAEVKGLHVRSFYRHCCVVLI